MASIITVENLSKRYMIGHQRQEVYSTLRDALTSGAKRVLNKLVSPPAKADGNQSFEEFWALKDVSFEIQEGDRVGIIGRNGAGKSTLLKILSRITEPTEGRIKIRGRVASLLEVGTGFHPELTGRENVYLNGAILGMSKAEIKQKFDEIVAFAEVEKFLDTPVKHYSSGMYVRLAFAVAAHLEPEILVVDEVLAVGDLKFQKKCLGKMEEVSNSGRTILLVSHNMTTILSLSNKVLLLANGEAIDFGPAHQVITTFQDGLIEGLLGQTDLALAEHYGNGKARFVSIGMRSIGSDGEALPFQETGHDLVFEAVVEAYAKFESANVGLTIYSDLGNRIIDPNIVSKGDALSLVKGQIATIQFRLKNVLLKPDCYTVGLWIGVANQEDIDAVRYATTFRMEARPADIMYAPPFPGVYACEFDHNILLSESS